MKGWCSNLGVMPGLDPGIHDLRPRVTVVVSLPMANHLMDCRVKPGNDGEEVKSPPTPEMPCPPA